jgi:hypothetical protein
MYTAFESLSVKGRDDVLGLGVDGRILLKWILKRGVMM